MINQADFLKCFKQELDKDPALKDAADYKEMMADLCSSVADPLKDKLTLTDQVEMMGRFAEAVHDMSSQNKEIDKIMIITNYLGGEEQAGSLKKKLYDSEMKHINKHLSALSAFKNVVVQQLNDPGQEPYAREAIANSLI